MNILGHMTVLPQLPERIARLHELSNNIYWTWKPEARRLFQALDRDLWDELNHSPMKMLRDVSQDSLDSIASNTDYLSLYDAVMKDFDAYLQRNPTWFHAQCAAEQSNGHNHGDDVYAYFCAEYGWHEAVALYSGGLGILAGDHTKAASDLGVPLVAVGLWYPEGYFHQRIAADGRQEAVYARLSPSEMPFQHVTADDGQELRVTVSLQGREVQLRAWHLHVGVVSVYLLDTDVPENTPEDRLLLARLYGGDQSTRIAQEIVLGIGGVRLLRALGINPTSWHMNEGHSAFMVLERCRELVAKGLSFGQAREYVASGTLFTVHTPVAAGNDAFPFELISQFFSGYWGSLGLNQQQFLELARHDQGWGPAFSMPALAMRFSKARNGVAKLHGETSRQIWSDLWSEVPIDEVPVGHITNGVHTSTWVAPELMKLFGVVLPPNWRERFDDADMWQTIKTMDNAWLWDVRQTLSSQSVRFLRRRVTRQLERHGVSPTEIHNIRNLFDPEALTIGFARRFATYKRSTLIFRDLDRLAAILNKPEYNVQLVFAGKAHPADEPGQALIMQIQELSRDPRFAGKILFIEDYDMAVGRALTRGVDVWLNTPRRPLEASGTSGQKAAMNGILNLSILDGWWPEAYNGLNGWAIGSEVTHANPEQADAYDADALYDLLEREVVPLYYERDKAGIPQAWLERSKEAIATVMPVFSAQRMVKDYVQHYYMPASQRAATMAADNYQAAKELAHWRQQQQEHWSSVTVQSQNINDTVKHIGDSLEVEAVLNSPELDHKGIHLELVYSLAEDNLNHNLHTVAMRYHSKHKDGGFLYRATFTPQVSGRLVYGIRAYPVHDNLVSPFDVRCVRWS